MFKEAGLRDRLKEILAFLVQICTLKVKLKYEEYNGRRYYYKTSRRRYGASYRVG